MRRDASLSIPNIARIISGMGGMGAGHGKPADTRLRTLKAQHKNLEFSQSVGQRDPLPLFPGVERLPKVLCPTGQSWKPCRPISTSQGHAQPKKPCLSQEAP